MNAHSSRLSKSMYMSDGHDNAGFLDGNSVASGNFVFVDDAWPYLWNVRGHEGQR
jgi:hypothetical protein